jgi:PBP1b-binding outer membrane lipoprotein LpoB
MKSIISISILFIILFLGCSAVNSGKVVRVDPREMRDTDANYGVEDLHIFIKSMMQSMLSSEVFKIKVPYLVLNTIGIGKGVDEHMDTRLIANSIRTNLIKTTKVHFIDAEYRKSLEGDKVKRIDYLLSGDIHAIKKNTTNTVDNFYMLSLKLTDAKNSKVVWTEDKEIRKVLSK